MKRIFISYAHEDASHAEFLAEQFGNRGWPVFWDREIPFGSNWREFVEPHLNEAACVVVLWSKSSIQSEWVKAEADYARDKRKLLPLVLDKIELPLGHASLNFVDLSAWDSKTLTPAFVRFLDQVARHLDPCPQHHPFSSTDTGHEYSSQASETIEHLTERQSGRPPLLAPAEAFRRGTEQFEARHDSSALQYFQKIPPDAGEFYLAQRHIGKILFLRQDYARSLSAYRAALDVAIAHGDDAGTADCKTSLARVNVAFERFPEAASLYEQLLETADRGHDPDIVYNASLSIFLSGQAERARHVLDRFPFEHAQPDAWAKEVWSHALVLRAELTIRHQGKQAYTKARQDLENALARDPPIASMIDAWISDSRFELRKCWPLQRHTRGDHRRAIANRRPA